MVPRKQRKTRIVCISDTHNATPKLPAGDVLIHAGDLTKAGTLAELHKTVVWLEAAPFEAKIVIAGNHDLPLDAAFYAEYGAHHHANHLQDPAAFLSLLKSSPTLTYIQHSSTTIRLTHPSGPRTIFRIFGSPYSPASSTPGSKPWAFQYPFPFPLSSTDHSDNPSAPEVQAADLWSSIPLSTDIVVTHTPPKYHVDEAPARGDSSGGSKGCEALRQALWRVRPRLAICGHVHEARGAERVQWDLAAQNVRFHERMVGYWIDKSEGSKRVSLVDLSTKGEKALDWAEDDGEGEAEESGEHGLRARKDGSAQGSWMWPKATSAFTPWKPGNISIPPDKARAQMPASTTTNWTSRAETRGVASSSTSPNEVSRKHLALGGESTVHSNDTVFPLGSSLLGQGFEPVNGRSDEEALVGRLQRRETCIVNAAIMAKSWPYKGTGSERQNKPIVIDLDLPTWDLDEAT